MKKSDYVAPESAMKSIYLDSKDVVARIENVTIVEFRNTGEVVVNPKYSTTEAAQAFWDHFVKQSESVLKAARRRALQEAARIVLERYETVEGAKVADAIAQDIMAAAERDPP